MSRRGAVEPFAAELPPDGVRLRLSVVAAELQVSLAMLAGAAGVSRSAMFRIATSNTWPARKDQAVIRTAVEALLQERGATAEQLATLWHAHMGRAVHAASPSAKHQPTAEQEEEEDPMQLMKQTLSPQAARHFKLFRNPFDGEVERDEQFFAGADVRWVREAAWACAKNGGFTAIVGESGAGKTTMLGDLEARLEADPQGVLVIKPSVLGLEENNNKGQVIKATDILHAVISTLDPTAPVPQTLQARTVRAKKLLAESAKTGNQHLLVIEEAHSLPDATLKHLKRLHELREGRRPLLGILLLAQPELKARLAAGLRSGALREVAQRCEVVELLPLDGELRPYLETRVNACGGTLQALIDDRAIDAMRERLTRKLATGAVSMCYPLVVNNLMTRALNQAAALGVPVIDANIVRAA